GRRKTVGNSAPHQPGRDEGTDTIKTAVRHVDDAHHAEDETQAGSNKKEDRRIKQRIQNLDDQNCHAIPLKLDLSISPFAHDRLGRPLSQIFGTAVVPTLPYKKTAPERTRARPLQSWSRSWLAGGLRPGRLDPVRRGGRLAVTMARLRPIRRRGDV